MTNKQTLLEAILTQLRAKRELLMRAAGAAHEEATHEESAAENKYDTRGLEASYLAAGQSKRIAALAQAIQRFATMPLRHFGPKDPIALGALVEVIDEDQEHKWFFLAPDAGGDKISWDTRTVSLLTPQSPLGQHLLGATVGDLIEVQLPNKSIEVEIASIT